MEWNEIAYVSDIRVKRVVYITSSASITPNADTTDILSITALAVGTTISNPSGTPVDGQRIYFRILDDGNSQTVTWGGQYQTADGYTLPSATEAAHILFLGAIYDLGNDTWVIGMNHAPGSDNQDLSAFLTHPQIMTRSLLR